MVKNKKTEQMSQEKAKVPVSATLRNLEVGESASFESSRLDSVRSAIYRLGVKSSGKNRYSIKVEDDAGIITVTCTAKG